MNACKGNQATESISGIGRAGMGVPEQRAVSTGMVPPTRCDNHDILQVGTGSPIQYTQEGRIKPFLNCVCGTAGTSATNVDERIFFSQR